MASATLVAAVAAILISAGLAGAAKVSAPTSGLYFVQLASPPTEAGTSLQTTKAEKKAFRDAVKQAGLEIRERIAYDTLFNGFSVEASDVESKALKQLDGVAAVWPVLTATIPPTQVAKPELAFAIQMTGADIAQTQLGLSGAGVRVAVMDSGIDYDHAALGGTGTDNDPNSDDSTLNGFPNGRVVTGWDFVGDDFNATSSSPDYNPIATPDPDPDDCNGHGTHVSGIVGANGAGVTGVAPGVTFGAYRVFGCDGGTTADIMLQAMERALKDKMDVLNMSIGSSFVTWPQYPTAAGADLLAKKGMVVVASIGNSGADGVFSAGAPGVGRNVIGVASIDNSHVRAPGFTISPDGTAVPYRPAVGLGSVPDPPTPPTSGTFPIAETSAGDAIGVVPPGALPTNDACNAVAPPAGFFAGKVALIRRGGCTFSEKAKNAEAAGAVAVVLYNNVPGLIGAQLATPPQVTIPVVSITQADGHEIHNRLVSGPVDLTWQAEVTAPNPTGGLVSGFSSYGLTAELDVKPDVAAPGGLIRSTWPLEKGAVATISGTSMSSPHVAGAAALILQAHPKDTPEDVRTVLQNSARPTLWNGNPGFGFLESVHRQGAGLIDIPASILATSVLEPSKLALGESESGPQTRTLTIENDGALAVTYALGDVGAIGTSNTFPNFPFPFLGETLHATTVEFSQGGAPVTQVTVPSGHRASVDVTITADPDPAADQTVYGGYLTFTGGGETLRVPYAGFVGDYQSLTVLQPGAAGIFPTIGRLTGVVSASDLTPVHTPVASGASFTMQAGDVPYVLAHFAHQARTLRIDLYSAATNALVGTAVRDQFLPRNSRRTGTTNDERNDVYFEFPLDGTVEKNKNKRREVADGSYYAKLSVLKALGDTSNPAHWETWTSNPFTIDRP